MMSEDACGRLAISIGTFWLVALIINGTFARTLVRALVAAYQGTGGFLTCFLWFQIAFGLWNSDAATIGLAVYPGLLVLDAVNFVAATRDAGSTDKSVSDDRP